MTVTFIALADPNTNQPKALARYTEAVAPLIRRAGGRPRGRFTTKKQLHGMRTPKSILLVDFPDDAAVERFLESDEYQALIPHRDEAFQQLDFLVTTSDSIRTVGGDS